MSRLRPVGRALLVAGSAVPFLVVVPGVLDAHRAHRDARPAGPTWTSAALTAHSSSDRSHRPPLMTMNPLLKGLPVGLAGLALAAPAAHAADQAVVHPAPGVTSVAINDTDTPDTVSVRVVTGTAGQAFSAIFADADGDHAADIALVAREGGGVRVLRTDDSTTDCQLTTGPAVAGATGALNADGSGWTARVPKAALPGDFAWGATGSAPGDDEVCGGTDGTDGLVLAGGFANAFDATPADPTPVDAAPAAPTGLTAVGGDRKVVLDWADAAESDVAGYVVYRRMAQGPFLRIATTRSSAFVDGTAVNDATYTYYVRAIDAGGHLSDESARVSATPAAAGVATPPAQPAGPAPSPDPVPAVAPRPAGTKKVGAVGPVHLLGSNASAYRPRFVASSGRVTVGALYNAESVHSAVVARFTVRVPVRHRASSRMVQANVRYRTVLVGRAATTLRPGQSVALTFKLNAAGRRLARTVKSMKVVAGLTVTPRGKKTRKGAVSVTVKKSTTRKRCA